jgi:carboxyl-terminal processing protease
MLKENKRKTFSHRFLRASLVSAALLTLAPGLLHADVKEIAESELKMTPDLAFDIHKTLYFLQFGHYAPKTLDDNYSARIFEEYLETLDPNKVFFTQKDIAEFEPYRYKLDDLLKRRDAQVAFDIFKVFRHKMEARTSKIMQLIDQDFDYTKHDALNIDRDSFTWAEDEKEIDQRWEKRIKNDTLQQLMAKTELSEVRENLKRRYQRQRDVIFQLKADEVFEWYMNSFTRDHGPHTTYMSHVTAENFEIGMSLQLTGIGAALTTDEDYTVINRILKGGPAEKSGAIEAEDKIIAVGQEGEEMINVIGWRLNDVVQMIRGDKGTKVRLDILPSDMAPGSPPERIELVRDLVQLEDQAAKLSEVTIPDGNQSRKYAVISIPSFYSNADQVARGGGKLVATTSDVEQLLQEVNESEAEGLILDLRAKFNGIQSTD